MDQATTEIWETSLICLKLNAKSKLNSKGGEKMKNPKVCPKCNGKGEVPRKDLPPFLKGAMGIRQNDECPVCHGVGYVDGS